MSLLALLAAQQASSTPPDPGTVGPLAWDRSVTIKVTTWGNSHYSTAPGLGATAGIDQTGTFKTVLDNSGAARVNLSVPGRTWRGMADHAADAIAAWSPLHDYNVLVVGETTNDVFGGSDGYTPRTTQAQVLADAHAAIDPILAAHPWIVLLCSTIPRGGTPDYTAQNALAESVDTYMGSHLEEFGAHGFVNFRSSPWFNGDGTTYHNATADPAYQWMGGVGRDWDYLPPPYIHPAGDPYTAFADCIGAGLATLTGATLPA